MFAPGSASPPPRAAYPGPTGASSRRRTTDPMTGIVRRANTPTRADVVNRTTTDCAGASRNFSEHQERMNVADHRGRTDARQCQRHPTDHRRRTRAVHGRIKITHASRQDGDRATTSSSLGSPALRRRLAGDVAGLGANNQDLDLGTLTMQHQIAIGYRAAYGFSGNDQFALLAATSAAQSSGGLPRPSIFSNTAYGSDLLPAARKVCSSLTHANTITLVLES